MHLSLYSSTAFFEKTQKNLFFLISPILEKNLKHHNKAKLILNFTYKIPDYIDTKYLCSIEIE